MYLAVADADKLLVVINVLADEIGEAELGGKKHGGRIVLYIHS
jgi:hypothetical protein